jgi:hypothetical protein
VNDLIGVAGDAIIAGGPPEEFLRDRNVIEPIRVSDHRGLQPASAPLARRKSMPGLKPMRAPREDHGGHASIIGWRSHFF